MNFSKFSFVVIQKGKIVEALSSLNTHILIIIKHDATYFTPLCYLFSNI